MVTSKDLIRRLDALESEGAIRRLMSEYQEVCDFGAGSGTQIANLFTADGIWEGVGRVAEVLGTHQGREAIAQRFSHLCPSPSTS